MSTLPATEAKSRYVSRMFGRIARRYDLMNRVISFGMDAAWRREVARQVRLGSFSVVLDVGTGTGRLALALKEDGHAERVVGVDFTEAMLRASSAAVRRGVHLAAADALRLPFTGPCFDAVVSGFLVRNVADVPLALREQLRVLKPGGRLVVLEITPGPTGLLGSLFRLYFRRLLPVLGRLIAGDSEAYTYLPESAGAFMQPERLAELLRSVGAVDVSTRRYALGTVAITTGGKPSRGPESGPRGRASTGSARTVKRESRSS